MVKQLCARVSESMSLRRYEDNQGGYLARGLTCADRNTGFNIAAAVSICTCQHFAIFRKAFRNLEPLTKYNKKLVALFI